MKTVLIILALIAVAAGAVVYFIKKGKIKDSDGDYIPDVVEDAAEDVEEFVDEAVKDGKELLADAKKHAEDLKEKYDTVRDELKDVLEEAADVVSAIKGKVTKTKLRQFTKKELLAMAQKDHGAEFPSSITKTNLVNKVYSLYNTK